MPVYDYIQMVFFLSELSLLLFKRSKNKSAANGKDRNSLAILWVVIALSLGLGPYIAFVYKLWPIGNYKIIVNIGLAIAIIGFVIRWTAVIQLGRMFTVDVAITDDHNLKTSGLYKIVRHPSYLGLILIIAGLGICLNSWLSFLIMIIPSLWSINHRIIIEEQALTAQFGEQYNNYKKRVSKIIPGIF